MAYTVCYCCQLLYHDGRAFCGVCHRGTWPASQAVAENFDRLASLGYGIYPSEEKEERDA